MDGQFEAEGGRDDGGLGKKGGRGGGRLGKKRGRRRRQLGVWGRSMGGASEGSSAFFYTKQRRLGKMKRERCGERFAGCAMTMREKRGRTNNVVFPGRTYVREILAAHALVHGSQTPSSSSRDARKKEKGRERK